jgi:hypothetical protein
MMTSKVYGSLLLIKAFDSLCWYLAQKLTYVKIAQKVQKFGVKNLFEITL